MRERTLGRNFSPPPSVTKADIFPPPPLTENNVNEFFQPPSQNVNFFLPPTLLKMCWHFFPPPPQTYIFTHLLLFSPAPG